MNIYKLRNIYIEIFNMYKLRKILLNIFSYSLLITAFIKIIFQQLFELEWIFFSVYLIFLALFIYSNIYIDRRQKIITAWYLLLIEKYKGMHYQSHQEWNALIKLLINLHQYDNYQVNTNYQINEEKLSRAFFGVIMFAFFVIFINVLWIEWLFWGLALVGEIFFKIRLYFNAKANFLIKWMLFESKHLLFFDKTETDAIRSANLLKKMVKQQKINKILKAIATKYQKSIVEIKSQLLANQKTSHHLSGDKQSRDLNLDESKVKELLNYDKKHLYQYYINNHKFFKLIAHKINY